MSRFFSWVKDSGLMKIRIVSGLRLLFVFLCFTFEDGSGSWRYSFFICNPPWTSMFMIMLPFLSVLSKCFLSVP